MKSRPFARGFDEVRRGVRFDDSDYGKRPDQAWHYERGRLLAAVYRGPLRINGRLATAAMVAMSDALKAGDIL